MGLLLLLLLLQSSNVWKSLSVSSTSDTFLLYALSSLNFIAFIVFALILVRSLLKLQQERRALKLGAKLKTRLLVYFFSVSLLPLIAMAVFSYLFMNRALERWFSQMPENVIRQAGELQTESVESQKEKAIGTAKIVSVLLEKNGVDQQTLDLIRDAGNLVFIEVSDKDKKVVVSSTSTISPELKEEFEGLLSVVRKGELDNDLLSDGKGLDAAVSDMSDGRRLLIVPWVGPKGSVGELVSSSLAEFDRLKSQQIFVRQLGLTTLGLLTFLLIFASSWAAFYVAKGLTRPIRALAEGADEIAKGNFSHRVEVLAEDELDLLVRAFNSMTARLEENSAELEERRHYIEVILQSLSTGVVSFDSETKVTTINKAAIGMLRLEAADVIGFTTSQLVNKENRNVFEMLITRAQRIGLANDQTTLLRENSREQQRKGRDGSRVVGGRASGRQWRRRSH